MEDLFSDEEDDDDCFLSFPPAKKVAVNHPPDLCRSVESLWMSEEADTVSLIIIRNPNVKCTVTATAQDTITLA